MNTNEVNEVEDAMEAIGQGFDATYSPDKKNTGLYKKRYAKYTELGEFIEEGINLF